MLDLRKLQGKSQSLLNPLSFSSSKSFHIHGLKVSLCLWSRQECIWYNEVTFPFYWTVSSTNPLLNKRSVLSLSHCWHNTQHTQLKRENVYFSSCYRLWLVSSNGGTAWERVMLDRKHKVKGGDGKGNIPFQAMPPGTCLFQPDLISLQKVSYTASII